jgi:hypothetical protein
MIVFLNGKGAKAALVDVAAAVVVLVVATDVGGEQPAHVRAQIPVLLGPQDQMEMVGHQAIGHERHGGTFAGFMEKMEEGGVVAVFAKDGAAAIASVEDMVAVTSLRNAWVAWHEGDYAGRGSPCQEKSTLSPFLRLLLVPFVLNFASMAPESLIESVIPSNRFLVIGDHFLE